MHNKSKAVAYHWALEREYQRTLARMVHDMWPDIYSSTLESYRQYNQNIDDYTSTYNVDQLIVTLNQKTNKWKTIFDRMSILIALHFVNQIEIISLKSVDRNMKNAYSITKTNTSLPKDMLRLSPKIVKTSPAAIRESLIKSNVALIKDIPEKLRTQIETQILTCVNEGRGVTYLQEKLQQIGKFTKNRANFIASDQFCKATESISREAYKALGVTHGMWDYTWRSKEPRKSHIEADGKVFLLSKGCKINGQYIYPAQLYGCKCSFRPIINE